MIAVISKLIAAILGLIRKGEYRQASESIDRIYFDFLREDSSFFHAIPEEELTRKLLQEHNYTNGHLEILAELFNAEAELELAQGNRNRSLDFSRKSLILFDFIDKEQKTFSLERADKMTEIRKRIEILKMP